MGDADAAATGLVRVRLFVCGERLRGDDAAALLAADRLPPDVLRLADVRPVGLLDVDALTALPEGLAIVVADAALGPPAGHIVIRALADVARGGVSPRSSHALPVGQALALAAELRGGLPPGSFVGIGGGQFELGAPLSPPVAAALDAFAGAIAEEVRRLAAATG